MSKQAFIVLIALVFFTACKTEKGVLIKIFKGEFDELGVECGYVDLKGDTIIPLNKYYYCYTDTLKHFAIVLKHDGGCIAIDSEGNELYEVYWFDNGPDYIKEGLFRIKQDGKVGFANTNGQIIIEPIYECASTFYNGIAKVSFNCSLIKEGEHSRMESSSWFYINGKGERVEK